jgi:adenylate cyclase
MRAGVSLLRFGLGLYHRLKGFLARRLRRNFYVYLAIVFSVLAGLDAFVFEKIVDMRERAYDLVIRSRFIKPEPDPQIVIVDIDESSLSAMAKDYGRWPWPRQVLGEFVEQISAQKPAAIVFDILFSDPDVFNPGSDEYFDAAIEASTNTFFPVLRLDEGDDAKSAIRVGMLPGVTPMPGANPDEARTAALVLPQFASVLKSGRVGSFNIYPDADGTARAYRLYHDIDGWRLPALPTRIGEVLGWKSPHAQDLLLNWRGKPFSYQYVSFSEVFFDLLSSERKRPQDEFAGKIIVVGSSAAGLFDFKPTPMDRHFPGVEIIATAIDNVKHGDFIRMPGSHLPALVATLVILWATALGFYRDIEADRFARIYGLSQVGLLVISYLTINLTNFYFNLAGPVFVGFLYFSVAKVYAMATATALERNLVAESLRGTGGHVGVVAVFHATGPDETSLGIFLRRMAKDIARVSQREREVELIKGRQRGIWRLLESTLVVTWLYDIDDTEQAALVDADVTGLLNALPGLVAEHAIYGEIISAQAVHRRRLESADGTAGAAAWRTLLSEALSLAQPDPQSASAPVSE